MGEPAVITGTGILTAAGGEVGAVWEKALAGDTGAIRAQPDLAGDRYPSKLAARLDGWDPAAWFDKREIRDLDPCACAALYAADRAVAAASLGDGAVDPDRFGVFFGTGFGCFQTSAGWLQRLAVEPDKRVSPLVIPMSMQNTAAFRLAQRFAAFGANRTVSTACSSSALALAAALDQLRAGRLDAALVVGAEVVAIPVVLRSWRGLRVMTAANEAGGGAYRPFDAGRSGFVMGEGAGAFVLESPAFAAGRGAPARGRLLGYGNNLDGTGITRPSADRQEACVREALADAGLAPGDIAFVAAHGSGTKVNDPGEAAALDAVFGRPLVAVTKPVYGHLMGASGVVEAALALESLRRRVVPRVVNLADLDPACPVAVAPPAGAPVAEAPGGGGPVCLVDSFGFGGTNVALAIEGPAGGP